MDLKQGIRIGDSKSRREKDENGFLIVRDNPIAKAGVFEYLLSEIQGNAADDRVIHVLRRFDDLSAKKELFKGKPIKFLHQWVGEEEKQADGAIFGEIREEEPYLVADLIFYNPDLIKRIEAGEVVELSPGYDAEFVEKKGSYDGKAFEFEQILKNVNHLAVVETGRSGHDLKVFDQKNGGFFMKITDAIYKALKRVRDEEAKEKKEDEQDEKIDLVKKIIELSNREFEGGEDQKIAEILKLLEPKEVEDEEDKEEEEKEEEKVKDEEEVKPGKDFTAEDVIEIVEKIVDKKCSKIKDELSKEQRKISDAYHEVSSILGTSFDFTGKTAEEIYEFGARALNNGKRIDDCLDPVTEFKVLSGMKRSTFNKPLIQDKSVSRFENLLKNFR